MKSTGAPGDSSGLQGTRATNLSFPFRPPIPRAALTPLAAALLLDGGALALLPETAATQAQGAAQHDYDLPAGPLAATLNRIA